MFRMPSSEEIKAIEAQYPRGTRIELVHMDDFQAPPPGTKGTVEGVDGAGDLLVRWDTGSGLKVILGEDAIRVLSRGEE